MKKIIAVCLFGIVGITAFAQDTITVMTYNLLNFPAQNPTRYNDLEEIIQYVKPDLFICSEITSSAGVTSLLNNSFNVGPINYYDHANWVDGPDTDNMCYFNTNKLTLHSQNQIPTALRDISHYKLYSCGLTDTIWYDVFSVHLKASQGITNANDRLAECVQLTNYIATLPTNTNIIVAGDFNFYGANPSVEPAWNQLTVASSQQLKDPINMVGEWHANVSYKNIHTQSTRSSTNSGCCGGSTGGLDDRFDFILINNNLKNGIEGAQYVTGSYKTIGNDGNHFNKSIIESPTNSSVPSAVNMALFNMSDHLPVMMKVYTCDITIGVEENVVVNNVSVSFPQSNQLLINANYLKEEKVLAEIFAMNGSVVYTENFNSIIGNNQFIMQIPLLQQGMYVLQLSSPGGIVNKKFVK